MTQQDNRPVAQVKVQFFEEATSLTISEKVTIAYQNRFYLFVKRFHNDRTELEICVKKDGNDLKYETIDLKTTRRFQDELLDVLDNKGAGRRIVLGSGYFDFVHLPNGEYGLAFANVKVVLTPKDALRLREFAAKTLH